MKRILTLAALCTIIFACSKAVSPAKSAMVTGTVMDPDTVPHRTVIKSILPATVIRSDSTSKN